ncbi:MAG: hypothetical protein Q7R82_00410 [Candidatus Daviesbacteria bacterium]|nr:hypothetical protein [Candidatus Daviesbacteria bacterium]
MTLITTILTVTAPPPSLSPILTLIVITSAPLLFLIATAALFVEPVTCLLPAITAPITVSKLVLIPLIAEVEPATRLPLPIKPAILIIVLPAIPVAMERVPPVLVPLLVEAPVLLGHATHPLRLVDRPPTAQMAAVPVAKQVQLVRITLLAPGMG